MAAFGHFFVMLYHGVTQRKRQKRHENSSFVHPGNDTVELFHLVINITRFNTLAPQRFTPQDIINKHTTKLGALNLSAVPISPGRFALGVT